MKVDNSSPYSPCKTRSLGYSLFSLPCKCGVSRLYVCAHIGAQACVRSRAQFVRSLLLLVNMYACTEFDPNIHARFSNTHLQKFFPYGGPSHSLYLRGLAYTYGGPGRGLYLYGGPGRGLYLCGPGPPYGGPVTPCTSTLPSLWQTLCGPCPPYGGRGRGLWTWPSLWRTRSRPIPLWTWPLQDTMLSIFGAHSLFYGAAIEVIHLTKNT